MINFEIKRDDQSNDNLVKNQLGKMTPLDRDVWCRMSLNKPPTYLPPSITVHPPYNQYTLDCAKALARMGGYQRYTLANLQKSHIHPSILLAIFHLLKTIFLSSQSPYKHFNTQVTGIKVLEKFSHYHHSAIHALSHELYGAFNLLYQAGTFLTTEARQSALDAYRKLHESITKRFGSIIKHHVKEFYLKFNPEDQTLYGNLNPAWHLSNRRVTEEIKRALHVTHQIAKGLFVIDIVSALYDSTYIMAHDPNWFPDLVHEIVDVESFIVVSLAVDGVALILAPTPIGWIGMIAVGLSTFASHHILMHSVLNPYLNYINRHYHART